MGNNETHGRSFAAKQQDLTFYTTVDDNNFGEVQIYTSKKMPLCYIMKICREINDSKIYNLFQKIQNVQSPCLVSLYGFQMDRYECCEKIVGQSVVSYWEYYNFYFLEYIKNRMQKHSYFLQSQFWHIVYSCCLAFIALRKNNCFYDFLPRTMVITPEGKLKILWGHLMSQNKHLKYFKYFESYNFQPFYFSPEELELIHSKELTNKLNFDKCNAFGLGIILLQCLTLTDPIKTCYTYQMAKVNFKAINYLIDTKIASKYSPHVTTLLKQLLSKDPKDRTTLQRCYQQYYHLMNEEYELRVCGGKKPQPIQKYDANQSPKNKPPDISDAKTVKHIHSSRKQ